MMIQGLQHLDATSSDGLRPQLVLELLRQCIRTTCPAFVTTNSGSADIQSWLPSVWTTQACDVCMGMIASDMLVTVVR